MKRKNMYSKIIFYMIGLLVILSSCKKNSEEIITEDQATVSVKLEGLEYDEELEISASTATSENNAPNHIQYADKDFHIESQLIPIKKDNQDLVRGIKESSSAALKELGANIKYKLLVYNQNGKLVASKDYTYRQETLESSIVLNTYDTFTFVVVSARSTSTLPVIENINDLSTAKIKNVNADLLYWKSLPKKLNKGQNFLAALLKPKFSEITTTIRMDQTMTGSITAISQPIFKPVAQSVTLNLSDGGLSYGAINTAGKGVTFFALGNSGLRTITSEPTTLVHSQTSAATLQFGSITVDGETKSNITVAGLSIKPGRRYNLILTLKTCTEAVNGLNGFNWEFEEATKWINLIKYSGIYFKPPGSSTTTFKKNGEIISFEFVESGADYGFIYDIMELDNAFNLEINGTPLVGNSVTEGEIQFQNNAALTTQNIEFEDGSQYQSVGNTSIPSNKRVKAIWEFKGTEAKPTVRVVIGRNGDVLIYGSKTDQGELFPLRLKNNLKFNKINWKGGSEKNVIKATSRVEGKTVMKSKGSGRKKVSCKD